jgi:hypothetical protein
MDPSVPDTDNHQHNSVDDDIERCAAYCERLKLSAPAILLLEACKPLHNLTEHALALLQPFGEQPGLGRGDVLQHPLLAILRDRRKAEALLTRLERGALDERA